MRDDFQMTGREVRINLILRGGGNDSSRGAAFGFVFDLPPGVWERSKGHDIHLVAKLVLLEAGTAPCPETEKQSPEDVLENGMPSFKAHP